jgi:hypothetical protein
MLFIHVVAGPHVIVGFAQLHGPFGVTFEVYTTEGINVGKGENLTAYFKNESFGTKGSFLRYARFGHAIIPKILNVHQLNN